MNTLTSSTVVVALRRLSMLCLWAAAVAFAPIQASAQEFRVPVEVPTYTDWEGPTLPEHWISVQGLGFTIHGSAKHLALLDRLNAHGNTAVPRLARELGIPVGGGIDVYLTDSQEGFRTMQPGTAPVYADGTAYPSVGAIFLRHPSLRGGMARPLEQVLDHELVHVLLGRIFTPQVVPRWLQEGMAQVYAGEVGPEISERISKGLLGREPFGLNSLTVGFPDDPHLADLAYAQSADFIVWFRGTYGDETLRHVVRQMASGRTARHAFHGATGRTLDQISDVWTQRLHAQTSLAVSPATFEGSLWALGGVLLLGGGFMRRRTFRKRMVEWEEEEEALDDMVRELQAQRRAASRSSLTFWR
jgi:hypothetical protein